MALRRLLGALALVLAAALPAGAVTVGPGETWEAAFDLTGESKAPPYSAVTWRIGFAGSAGGGLLDVGEEFELTLYDATGTLLLTQTVVETVESIVSLRFNNLALAAPLTVRTGTVRLVTSAGTALEIDSFTQRFRATRGRTGTGTLNFSQVITAVPLPPSLALFLGALGGVVLLGRRRTTG